MDCDSPDVEVCAGYALSTRTSCLALGAAGVWEPRHGLQHSRAKHSSWASTAGLVILGGEMSPQTTEILHSDGTSSPGFPLQHRTWSACTIGDPATDSVVVTGGQDTRTRATRYNLQGWLEELPSLASPGRYNHACAAYTRADGARVGRAEGNILDRLCTSAGSVGGRGIEREQQLPPG